MDENENSLTSSPTDPASDEYVQADGGADEGFGRYGVGRSGAH